MKIKSESYQITPTTDWNSLPTRIETGLSTRKINNQPKKISNQLSDLQEIMYAQHKYSVLICLQGMDTAGKDSLIREVFSAFNPRGVEVSNFKTPTALELSHDFLWRHYIALPERGVFGVFNRSHYENVLIARVHPEIVLNENIPNIDSVETITPKFWKQRFKQIKNFEKNLVQNGTLILKFYLHLSYDEQRERILRRLDKPQHNWKFEPSDIKERKYWNAYQECYQDALQQTATKKCPWFVIPADDKETARLLVAQIILEHLQNLPELSLPELDPEIKEKINGYRKSLLND
ncbi:polyphosphate kinase 2 family protein [Flavobacterium agricola]|uniref:Polyphosphate kinase 2 family protein n=2 Tax=Flavobacterium agricola TaxID=2870839 RepID=A0ABY6LXT8_9FLAO|nr:PPK2 family polyphosphate kinase [Flavobacterium agricola]UYW00357.1 polyphosphate kinase 2 family protein [Flavobacterium agricola]